MSGITSCYDGVKCSLGWKIHGFCYLLWKLKIVDSNFPDHLRKHIVSKYATRIHY